MNIATLSQGTVSGAWDAHKQAWFKYRDVRWVSVPEYARPAYIKPNDSKANGLTNAIVDYCNWTGSLANRINTMGVFDAKRGKYRHSTTRRGTADISITINGKSVWVEVKVGRDKMSEHQNKFREDIERAGGIYFVAHSFPEFYQFYQTIVL